MREAKLDDVSTVSLPKRGVGAQALPLVPTLTIVSHPFTRRVGERLLLGELLAGKNVELSRRAPDFVRPGQTQGASLADPHLSRKPIIFAPGEGGRVRLLVEDGGTQVVAGELIRGGREFSPEELAAGIPLELAERVVLLLHQTEPDTGEVQDSLGMVGQSPAIRRVRRHISQVADLKVSVLIRGETGTGKELVARAIHQHSRRRDARFISVNLGAINKELAEADFFGTKRGAFTGAQEREGLFRRAHGGTLFLDEVGEALPDLQVKLLRALEEEVVSPVGSDTIVPTDVRVVAATDANLEEQISNGRFKEPLKHRLAGYEIRLPPLRERREDIGLIFFHFAREALAELGEAWRLDPEDPYAEPWLPAPLAARLVRHSWSGNIRQLRNVTRQLVIANRGQKQLSVDSQLDKELGPVTPLGRPLRMSVAVDPQATPAPKAAAELKEVPRRKPADIPEQELRAALRANSWDLKKAADQLGIPRPSIYDLLRKYDIRTAGDLSTQEITRCYHECKGNLDAMVPRLEVSKQALRRRIKEIKELKDLELGA
ncbi:MAG TPA: sigma-54 dependent transcriptional regulator [Archangium sp.]|uniref:sigma-54 dependent transcriptional regulator n=1 Tax=Archangium sp. TaxID=1872627 RepID=UPI002E36773E|nr:sigma-54 dependent transcriptional regulator [Archangium sp.]HEX5749028.1 sigma-54 dependent transcriptional regulator [Archangium sp.]